MISAPGTHTAKVISHAWGESSTGKEQLELTFSTAEGNIRAFLYFTEGAAERSMDALENCGWDGKSLRALDGLGSIECQIVVEAEEYQGKQRLKVQWINKLSSSKPLPEDSLSALEKRLASKMAERRAAKGDDFRDPFA